MKVMIFVLLVSFSSIVFAQEQLNMDAAIEDSLYTQYLINSQNCAQWYSTVMCGEYVSGLSVCSTSISMSIKGNENTKNIVRMIPSKRSCLKHGGIWFVFDPDGIIKEAVSNTAEETEIEEGEENEED